MASRGIWETRVIGPARRPRGGRKREVTILQSLSSPIEPKHRLWHFREYEQERRCENFNRASSTRGSSEAATSVYTDPALVKTRHSHTS